MPFLMPQLRPIIGFVMFVVVIALIFAFIISVRKKYPKVNNSKMETLGKPSFIIFKLWNGRKMPKL